MFHKKIKFYDQKNNKIKYHLDSIKNILKDDYIIPNCQREKDYNRIENLKIDIEKFFLPVTPIYFCIYKNKRRVIDGQHRLDSYSKINNNNFLKHEIPIVDIFVNEEKEIYHYFKLINNQMNLEDVDRMEEEYIKKIILETKTYFKNNYPKSFHNKNKHKVAYKPYMWDDIFSNQITELLNPEGEYDLMNKYNIYTSKEFIEVLENLNMEFSKLDYKKLGCAEGTIKKIKKSKLLYFGLFKNNWIEAFLGTEGINLEKIFKKYKKIDRNTVWIKYMGETFKNKCWCCNINDISILNFHVGHIKAKTLGGSNDITNLRPICSFCNTKMSTKHMFEYMKENGYKLKN